MRYMWSYLGDVPCTGQGHVPRGDCGQQFWPLEAFGLKRKICAMTEVVLSHDALKGGPGEQTECTVVPGTELRTTCDTSPHSHP